MAQFLRSGVGAATRSHPTPGYSPSSLDRLQARCSCHKPRSAVRRACRASPKPPHVCWNRRRPAGETRRTGVTGCRAPNGTAFPQIGKIAISEVASADVREVLAPIWHAKAETIRWSFERIRALLEWAGAMELRIDNPCDRIAAVPHGFRSSFRDRSAGETDDPREVIEAGAGVRGPEQGRVGLCRRTDLFRHRPRLREDGVAYLAGESREQHAGPIR